MKKSQISCDPEDYRFPPQSSPQSHQRSSLLDLPRLKPVGFLRFRAIQNKSELEDRDVQFMKQALSKSVFEDFLREQDPKIVDKYLSDGADTRSDTDLDSCEEVNNFSIFRDAADAKLAPGFHLTTMVIGKRRVGKTSFVQLLMAYKYSSVQIIFEQKLGEFFKEYTVIKHDDSTNERINLLDTPGYDPNSKESMDEWYNIIETELIKRVGFVDA